jgi:hypothetical protein
MERSEIDCAAAGSYAEVPIVEFAAVVGSLSWNLVSFLV